MELSCNLVERERSDAFLKDDRKEEDPLGLLVMLGLSTRRRQMDGPSKNRHFTSCRPTAVSN